MNVHPAREDYRRLAQEPDALLEQRVRDLDEHLEQCATCRDVFDQCLQDDEAGGWRKVWFGAAADVETTAEAVTPTDEEPSEPSPPHFRFIASPREGFQGKIQSYHLQRSLGDGGMGSVYLAWDEALDRWVAIKLPRPELAHSGHFKRRFENEARAAAQIQHPHVVATYHVGEAAELAAPFLVMEYVEGAPLSEHLKESKVLLPRRAAEIARQSALGLAAAHQRRLIHRDVKPSNLLLEKDTLRVRITDFGLARALDSQDDLTRTGDMPGTIPYMSPEQARGEPVDARSDIFSLGLVLYEMLTGERVFRGTSAAAVLEQVRSYQEPLRPRLVNHEVPRNLETITLRCLAKEKDRRYQTAQAVAEDLERFLDGKPILARPVGPVERTVLWVRRHPLVAGLSAAIGLLLLMVAIGATWAAIVQANLRRDRETVLDQKEAVLYSSLMHLVERERAAGSPAAIARLAECQPERRGWEWHLYRRLFDGLSVLRGHTAPVGCLAWSHDGRRLASAADDRTVRIWDSATGEERQVIGPHSDAVQLIAFSPDGQTIVTVGTQGRIVSVWELAGGLRHEYQLDGLGLALSPDGASLAALDSTFRVLRLLDPATGQERWAKPAAEGWAYLDLALPNAVFSRNGQRLATILRHEDGRALIRVWDVASGREVSVADHLRAQIGSLELSPDGRRLASITTSGVVTVWDTAADDKILKGIDQQIHTGAYSRLAFSPDGSRLLVTIGAVVRVWALDRLSQVAQVNTLLGHDERISVLAYSPDGKLLATAGQDHAIRLWDPQSPAGGMRSLPGHEGYVGRLAFSPSGDRIASAGDDQTVKVWDSVDGRLLQTLHHQDRVRFVAFAAADQLVSADEAGTITTWDLIGGEAVATRSGIKWCVGLSPDGRRFAAAQAESKQVRIGDTATGRELVVCQGEVEDIQAAIFGPDGRRLATAGATGQIQLWDAADGRELMSFSVDPEAVRDYRTGLAFSQDGRFLAGGGGTRKTGPTVVIWDLSTGKEMQTLRGHASGVAAIAFHPDGARLVSLAGNWSLLERRAQKGEMKLWDLASGQELPLPVGNDLSPLDLAFSPDGHRLVTIRGDSALLLMDATPTEERP